MNVEYLYIYLDLLWFSFSVFYSFLHIDPVHIFLLYMVFKNFFLIRCFFAYVAVVVQSLNCV